MESRRPLTSATAAVLAFTLLGSVVFAALGSSRRSAPPSPALEGWSTVSAASFGDLARSFAGAVEGADLEPLVDALHAGEGEVPTRAAVLLGVAAERGPDAQRDRARAALLGVLERRAEAGGRERIGRTVVAARALVPAATDDAELRGTLVGLAQGEAPHPDLATRVECAYAVAEAGAAREVAPFLLSVMRAETPDEARSPRSWPRMTTLAWVKIRAAEALARAAGIETDYHPDAPWAHQMREADRLEALLMQ